MSASTVHGTKAGPLIYGCNPTSIEPSGGRREIHPAAQGRPHSTQHRDAQTSIRWQNL